MADSRVALGSADRLAARHGGVLASYGAAHALIDANCAALVYGIALRHDVSSESFVGLLLLYHVVAFALQPLCGLVVDAVGRPRAIAVLGCLVCTSGLFVAGYPLLAIVLAGLGNAMLHVAGGYVCLRLTPDRATASGLYVAPGALGLLIGAPLAATGSLGAAVLSSSALIVCVLLLRSPVPASAPHAAAESAPGGIELVLACMLAVVAIRSFLGFNADITWKAQPAAAVALGLATALGQALGGVLADRWGWLRVGLGATLAALPCLACASVFPLAAIPGMFLLNLTMPITLAAVGRVLPGHAAFAFGLASLALFLGMVPTLAGMPSGGAALVVLLMLVAAGALYRGLRPRLLVPALGKREVRI